MTCKTHFSDIAWQRIRLDIAARACPHCGKTGLFGGDAALPFDQALLSTWNCRDCREEIAFVISKDGTVYRT